MTKAAILVRDNLRDFNGHAALYRLDPPMDGREAYGTLAPPFGPEREKHQYVIASATTLSSLYHQRPGVVNTETYLFAADASGEVTDWCELPGSMRGTLDHSEVFANVGYEIA